MREKKGLDYQVEKERSSISIIPEDIFRRRDAIPIYGFGSSGWRWVKEMANFISSSGTDIGVSVKGGLRMFSRLLEFGAVGGYNVGIVTVAEALYLMLKN